MLTRKRFGGAAALAALILICGWGCGSSDRDKPTVDHLAFDVVDSLLGPVYEIESAGKSFRPPVGFEPAPDSILQMLKTTMIESIGLEPGVELRQCFLNPVYNAGVLVAEIDGLMLSSDTATFLSRYRQSLWETYGQESVREGEYGVERVFVKNFLITDSANVHFQLICLSDSTNAVELNYFCPRVYYTELVKLFESSIGSLKLKKQGGKL